MLITDPISFFSWLSVLSSIDRHFFYLTSALEAPDLPHPLALAFNSQ